MSRNRMIKPGFWDDEKLATIKRDSRLVFIALWNLADDYGIVKGNSIWLKNRIFPYDEKIKLLEFNTWLDDLIKIKVIYLFIKNDEKFYYIKNFLEHQIINRPSKKRNPEPPDNILESSLNIHGVISEDSCLKHKHKHKHKHKEKEKYNVVQENKTNIPYQKIIEYLNQKTGKSFQYTTEDTKKFIKARWNQGFDINAFIFVIDIKTQQWLKDPKCEGWLRPQTLFGTKFESYLNETAHSLRGQVSDKTIQSIDALNEWELEENKNGK